MSYCKIIPFLQQLTLLFYMISTAVSAETLRRENKQAEFFTLSYWEASYIAEKWGVLRSEQEAGSRYLDNLDLIAESKVNFPNVPQISLHGHILYNNDTSLSERVGDMQSVSNIDAPEALRLYELWLETDLSRDISVRAGIYDLNSEFDVTENAQLFLNGSHGIGAEFSQSGENGPSVFPITSLALRLKWSFSERWIVQFSTLDAIPGDKNDPTRSTIGLGDGTLNVIEVGYQTEWRQVHAALGHWRYSRSGTGSLALKDRALDDKNYGSYAILEMDLWQDQRVAERRVGAFLRYGVANRSINDLDEYLGMGISYHSPLPQRRNDIAGIALASARASTALKESQGTAVDSHETALELTYSLGFNSWLTIQPNVQYVINPGLDAALANSWIAGVRFTIGKTSTH